MAKRKKYWELPWDVNAWRNSRTRFEMTLSQRAIYFELLNYQWVEGSIPVDPIQIAMIASVSLEEVEPILPTVLAKFETQEDGRLVNRRLEEVRAEKEAIADKRRKSGSMGGRPVSESKTKPLGSSLHKPCLPNVSSYVVPDSVVADSCSSEEFQALLETLKDEHPGSYNPNLASQYLSSKIAEGHTPDDILIAHRDAQKVWAQGRHAPDLQRWIADYDPKNKLVPFPKDTKEKPKSMLAQMQEAGI